MLTLYFFGTWSCLGKDGSWHISCASSALWGLPDCDSKEHQLSLKISRQPKNTSNLTFAFMCVGLVLNPVTGCLIISNTKVIRLGLGGQCKCECERKPLACDVEKWKENALGSAKKKIPINQHYLKHYKVTRRSRIKRSRRKYHRRLPWIAHSSKVHKSDARPYVIRSMAAFLTFRVVVTLFFWWWRKESREHQVFFLLSLP